MRHRSTLLFLKWVTNPTSSKPPPLVCPILWIQPRKYKSSFNLHPLITMSSLPSDSAKPQQQQAGPPLSPTTTNKPPPHIYRRQLPKSCISFSSPEGKAVFARALAAGHMECYFSLAAQFRTQDEPAYCGLTTLVMVLNALAVDPLRVWKGIWRWYHEDMLDCCVPINIVKEQGITLDQFDCLAECNGIDVKTTYADSAGGLTEQQFRKTIECMTRLDDQFMVCSYSRAVLGQTGSGHFSPVGGYDPEEDLVLMLDTARFKYPPHWIKVSLLYEAMQALDKTTGKPRGFCLVRRSLLRDYPLLLFRISADLSVMLPRNSERNMLEVVSAWNSWLQAQYLRTRNLPDSDSVIKEAVQVLFSLLKSLPDGHTLLTTQVDVKCPHSITPEHICAIRLLKAALETIPVYVSVGEVLRNSDFAKTDLLKAGMPNSILSAQVGSGKSICKVAQNACGAVLDLQPEHFVTMLLLAWPYQDEIKDSPGDLLAKVMAEQLKDSSAELNVEVEQLNKKLKSVLGFHQKCSGCKCC